MKNEKIAKNKEMKAEKPNPAKFRPAKPKTTEAKAIPQK